MSFGWFYGFLNMEISRRKASPTVLAPMCRQMSFMLDAGVQVKDVISIMADTPSKNRRQQETLRSVTASIMRGESLSFALGKSNYFPAFMSSICRIGEISDNLPKVMALLADYYEETAKNREQLISALLYPAIVAFMMTVMIFTAVLFVLPNYALMFEVSDAPLPLLTRALLSASGVVMSHLYYILPFVVTLASLCTFVMRKDCVRSYSDVLLLKIPIYRQMINLRLIQTLSLLMQSGQPLSDAVLAVSDIIENKRVARDLQVLSAGLQEGASFWTQLCTWPYIDRNLIGMTRVGEETGNMAQVFNQANVYSQYRFRQMSKRLNKMIEPAVTLVLGVVLGLVMLSVILPAFAMTELAGF